MAKLLLVVAVFTVVYLILRSYKRKGDKPAPPAGGSQGHGGQGHGGQDHGGSDHGGSDHGGSKHGEDMVRCRICGIHLPKSEAITSRDEIFCSREHLQLADRERDGR